MANRISSVRSEYGLERDGSAEQRSLTQDYQFPDILPGHFDHPLP